MKTLWARMHTSQAGWSLLELVVVVGLLAFIATLAGPRLLKAIERANKAPGKADMAFLQAALERYQLDYGAYPVADTGNVANAIMTSLRDGYVRPTTTFRNGYQQGYLYLTSTDGTGGYYLVDLEGADDSAVTVHCEDVANNPGVAQDRTFTVATGEGAGLTPPDKPASEERWVSGALLPFCTFSAGQVYKVATTP